MNVSIQPRNLHVAVTQLRWLLHHKKLYYRGHLAAALWENQQDVKKLPDSILWTAKVLANGEV